MHFLNPIMLLGTAAIVVPIIIHLLNLRKFQKVVWAAMRFLQVSVEQNQRRMRIEDLLLLLLRCLLLVLLALALARPTFLSEAGDWLGRSKVTGVVILDNSYSMGMSDGIETRFDKGRTAAEQAVESMPAGSSVAVLLASDLARAVIPEPTFDLHLARQAIGEALLSDRATDLFPALQEAVRILRERPSARREIYLVTDGQALGWRQLTEARRLLESVKSELTVQIVLVTDEETRNLAVSDLELTTGLSPAGQPLRVEVKVTNHGKEEEKDVRVSLGVDDEPPGDEFTLASIPGGTTRSVSLFARLSRPGYHGVTARLAEDRLPADDRRTLAVRAVPQVRVLLVDGEPAKEPYDSETFFLRHVLAPVSPESAADYFIQSKVVTASELAQTRLDDYDAIILANVPDFSEATRRELESYLRRGGGLMVFPGSRVNLVFYNEQLFKRTQILPASLGPARGDAEQDDVHVTFQEQNYVHRMVALWNDPAAGRLNVARFYRRYEMSLPPWTNAAPAAALDAGDERPQEAGEPRVVLRYADGLPAVVMRDWGLGRVILFSSTADTAWNDLPVRPAFVPLVHRALGALVARQDEGLNIQVGGKFSRRVRMEFLDQDAIYVKPRQREVRRDLRRIELVEGWPTLQYDETDLAGFYEVSVVEPPLALRFAAQPDPSESDLERISPAELARLGEVARVVFWNGKLSLKNLAEQDRSGTEVWLPLALLVIVLASFETFLGQWFSRAK